MDMSTAIIPKSDQINADDLLTGARTFTIERVTEGSQEQPANVFLAESPGKPYRPGKSMSRVMVKAWGADSDAYVGQKLTLYCDPDVKFGGSAVGGIRISHMTGIDGVLKVSLTETRGKKKLFTVQPLANEPVPTDPSPDQVAACTTEASLKALWEQSSKSPAFSALVSARKAELVATAPVEDAS